MYKESKTYKEIERMRIELENERDNYPFFTEEYRKLSFAIRKLLYIQGYILGVNEYMLAVKD